MGLGSVVFFEHQIAASPFEKNFYKVRCVRVAIDNQDAPSFFRLPNRRLNVVGKNPRWFPAEKSLFRLLCSYPFRSRSLLVA